MFYAESGNFELNIQNDSKILDAYCNVSSATGLGGAVFFFKSIGSNTGAGNYNLNVSDALFQKCVSANWFGLGVFHNVDMVVTDTIFDRVSGSGGQNQLFGMYNTNAVFDRVTVSNSVEGTSYYQLINLTNTNFAILNSTFVNLKLTNGDAKNGIISVSAGSNLYVANSTFAKIHGNAGSVITMKGGNAYIVNSILTNSAGVTNAAITAKDQDSMNKLIIRNSIYSSVNPEFTLSKACTGNFVATENDLFGNTINSTITDYTTMADADLNVSVTPFTLQPVSPGLAGIFGTKAAFDTASSTMYYLDGSTWRNFVTGDAATPADAMIIKLDQNGADRADKSVGSVTVADTGLMPETIDSGFKAAVSSKDAETGVTTWLVTTNLDVVDYFDYQLSLREAINNATNGDIIRFADSAISFTGDNGITYNSAHTFADGSAIVLDAEIGQWIVAKSMTIDGQVGDTGRVTLRVDVTYQEYAADSTKSVTESRLFFISKDIDVTLKNLKMLGGKANAENSAAANGKADKNCGGIIFNFDARLTLDNVYAADSAAENGGIIYSYSHSNKDYVTYVKITDSELTRGFASNTGGLIKFVQESYNGGQMCYITDSVLSYGIAGKGGGFFAQNADNSGTSGNYPGDATSEYRKTGLVIEGSTIEYNQTNTSSTSGSAIHIIPGGHSPDHYFILEIGSGTDADGNVKDTVFSNNQNGTGVIFITQQTTMTLDGVTFKDHATNAPANLIYIDRGTDTVEAVIAGKNGIITNTSFLNNNVNGYLISSASSAVIMANSFAYGNTAAGLIGGSSANTYLSNTIVNNTFTKAVLNGVSYGNIVIGNSGGDAAASMSGGYNLIGDAGTDSGNNFYNMTLETVFGSATAQPDTDNRMEVDPAGIAVTNGILTGFSAYDSTTGYTCYLSTNGTDWINVATAAAVSTAETDTLLTGDRDGVARNEWAALGAFDAGSSLVISNDFRTVAGTGLDWSRDNFERKLVIDGTEQWISCSNGWRAQDLADMSAADASITIIADSSISTSDPYNNLIVYGALAMTNSSPTDATYKLSGLTVKNGGTLSLNAVSGSAVTNAYEVSGLTVEEGGFFTANGNLVLAGTNVNSGKMSLLGKDSGNTAGSLVIAENATLTNNGTLIFADSGDVTVTGTVAFDAADSEVIYRGMPAAGIIAATYNDLTVTVSAALSGNTTVNGVFSMIGSDSNILTLNGNSYTLTLGGDTSTADDVSENIRYVDFASITMRKVAAAGVDPNVYVDSSNTFTDAGCLGIYVVATASITSGGSLTYGQTLADATITGTINVLRGTAPTATFSYLNETTKPTVADSGVTEYEIHATVTSVGSYVIANTKSTVTVSAKNVTMEIDASKLTKVYDGTTDFVLTGDMYNWNGVLAEDEANVALTAGTAELSTYLADQANTTVTLSGFGLAGTAAANYNLVDENGNQITGDIVRNATITKKALVITIADKDGNFTDQSSFVYGTAGKNSLIATDNGIAATDSYVAPLEVTTDRGVSTAGYYNAGTHTASLVNAVSLKHSDGTDVTSCYTITTEGVSTFEVTQKALTGLAASKVYDAATAFAAQDLTLAAANGLMDGDDLTASLAAQTLTTANAGNYTAAADQVTLSGNDAGNYSFSGEVTLTVDKRQVNVTAVTGTYGDTSMTLVTANGTGEALVGSSTISGMLDTDLGLTDGNYNAGTHTVTGLGTLAISDAENYELGYTLTTFTVAQRQVTVAFNPIVRDYTGTDVFTLDAADYTLSLSGGVDQAADFSLEIASGEFSTLQAGVSGTTVTLSGINLLLNGADATNYLLVDANGAELTDVTLDATINKASISLTVSDKYGVITDGGSFVYASQNADFLSIAADGALVGQDSFTAMDLTTDKGLSTAGYHVAGLHTVLNDIRIQNGDGVDVTQSYIITVNGIASFTVDQKAITGLAASKVYDATTDLAAQTLTVDAANGLVAGDLMTADLAAQTLTSANAGNYTAAIDQVTLSGNDAANYIVTEDVAVTVEKRQIELTGIDGIYGDSALSFITTNGTGDALVGDSTVTGSVETDLGTSTAGHYNAGTHTVTGLGTLAISDSENYELSLNNTFAGFTVDKRQVTVSFDEPIDKVYNGTDVYVLDAADYSFAADAAADGEELKLTITDGTFSTWRAGVEGTTVTLSGMGLVLADDSAADNYELVDANGNLLTDAILAGQIDRAAITITVMGSGSLVDGEEFEYAAKNPEFVLVMTDAAELAPTDTIDTASVATDLGKSTSGNYVAGLHTVQVTFTLVNGDVDSTDCYDITYAGVKTFNVTPKAITGLAASKVYDATADVAAQTLTVGADNGLVAGDDLSAELAAQILASVNAGDYTAAADQVTLSGDDAANYIVAGDTAITVAARQIELTYADSVYGEEAVLTIVSGELAGSDTLAGEFVTDRGVSNDGFFVAGSHTITGIGTVEVQDGNDSANYEISWSEEAFNVAQRELVIDVKDVACKVGDRADDVTATFAWELTDGETVGSDKLNVTLSSSEFNTQKVAVYPITAAPVVTNGADDVTANYAITVQPGEIVVSSPAISPATYEDSMISNPGAMAVPYSLNSFLTTSGADTNMPFVSTQHLNDRNLGELFATENDGRAFSISGVSADVQEHAAAGADKFEAPADLRIIGMHSDDTGLSVENTLDVNSDLTFSGGRGVLPGELFAPVVDDEEDERFAMAEEAVPEMETAYTRADVCKDEFDALLAEMLAI